MMTTPDLSCKVPAVEALKRSTNSILFVAKTDKGSLEARGCSLFKD